MPEFAFEATEVYKTTLDLNTAISEGKRLSEIQKRKLEAEAERKAAEEAEPVVVSKPENATAPEQTPETEARRWVGFEAYITTDEARLLRDFFIKNNINYRSPKK